MTDRLCKKKGSDKTYRLLQIMPNSSFLVEDVKTGEIEIAMFGTVVLVPLAVVPTLNVTIGSDAVKSLTTPAADAAKKSEEKK